MQINSKNEMLKFFKIEILGENNMTLEEVEFELEMAGLTREQQIKLLSFVESNGYDAKMLDKKLSLMGYEPVFTLYDDGDED